MKTQIIQGMNVVEMTYEEWAEQYEPETNMFEEDAPYDGCMFETYGDELACVRGRLQENPRQVWTLLDCDGEMIITEGFHFVNRMGYFITGVAAPENTQFTINAD